MKLEFEECAKLGKEERQGGVQRKFWLKEIARQLQVFLFVFVFFCSGTKNFFFFCHIFEFFPYQKRTVKFVMF